MGTIGLAEVHAGVVLCADVVAAGDRLLLEAGTELTDRHLRIFAMWGVAEVDVEGISEADVTAKAAAQRSPSDLARVEARVQALFRHNDRGHPVVSSLVRLTTLRLIRQAGGALYATDALGPEGITGPGTAFLQKPFSAVALAREVRTLLDAR